MPFTPAHVAAVLPLLRRSPLVPAALVIGSMAPDIGYFVPLPASRHDSHSLVAAFTTTALVGLGAWLLWTLLLAAPVRVFLAPWLRTPPAPAGGQRHGLLGRGLAAYVSVVLGTLTHDFWDGFTHAGDWAVLRWPVLMEAVGPLPAYRWLQYGSGVVGLVALAVWARRRSLVRWPRRADVGPRRWLTVLALGTALLLGAVRGVALGDGEPRASVFLAITHAGSAVLAVVTAAALAWWARRISSPGNRPASA